MAWDTQTFVHNFMWFRAYITKLKRKNQLEHKIGFSFTIEC